MFSSDILGKFDTHAVTMRDASRARREAVQLRAAVDDHQEAATNNIFDTLGVRQAQDQWQGCVNLRTLRTLLGIVDDRGFERCAGVLAFTHIRTSLSCHD